MHKTNNLNDNYLGSGKALRAAIKKYGKKNFLKEILFIFDNEIDMKNKEKELVSENICLSRDNYNLCEGGKGGFGYINRNKIGGFGGHKHSEKTKKSLAELAKLNKNLPIYKPGYVPWNKNKIGIYTEEQLKKWRKPLSEERKNKIAKTLKGYRHSEETKLKMSESQKRRRKKESIVAGVI